MPTESQTARYQEIERAILALKESLAQKLPEGDELARALLHLDETLRLAGVVCASAE